MRLIVSAAPRDHQAPGVHATRERDLVHPRIGDQRRAGDRAIAGDDVHDAWRQIERFENLGEHQRGERRLLGRLQHHGAPGGQRRRQLPRGHQQRIVPRDDLADDADGLAHDHRQRVVGHFERLAMDLRRQPAVILEAVRGVG